MFLRIFPAERTRKAVYIGVVLSILFPIAFGLPMTFACRPISGTYSITFKSITITDNVLYSGVDILGRRNAI